MNDSHFHQHRNVKKNLKGFGQRTNPIHDREGRGNENIRKYKKKRIIKPIMVELKLKRTHILKNVNMKTIHMVKNSVENHK